MKTAQFGPAQQGGVLPPVHLLSLCSQEPPNWTETLLGAGPEVPPRPSARASPFFSAGQLRARGNTLSKGWTWPDCCSNIREAEARSARVLGASVDATLRKTPTRERTVFATRRERSARFAYSCSERSGIHPLGRAKGCFPSRRLSPFVPSRTLVAEHVPKESTTVRTQPGTGRLHVLVGSLFCHAVGSHRFASLLPTPRLCGDPPAVCSSRRDPPTSSDPGRFPSAWACARALLPASWRLPVRETFPVESGRAHRRAGGTFGCSKRA